jgi:autotransporter-associated beta strand protein
VWDGSESTVWSNPLNWDSGVVPSAGDDLVFNSETKPFSNNNLPADTTFNSITIERAAQITGRRFRLGAGGLTARDPSVDNQPMDVTISAPIFLTSTSGPISVRNGLVLGSDGFPDFTGPGTTTTLSLTGAVTGPRLVKLDNGLLPSGTLVLSGAGTSLGSTVVEDGTLRATVSMTLGTSTGGGVTVDGDAALDVRSPILTPSTIATGVLTLQGATLRKPSTGNVTVSGTVVIQEASTISTSFGTLTLSGTIDNSVSVLTVEGSGSTVFAGALRGLGSLIKNGNGRLMLSGSSANTYAGLTTVNDGVLRLEKSSALGATGLGVQTAAGATVELAGGITIANEPLAFDGSTLPLRNSLGTNTWTSNLALNQNTAVIVDTGTLRLTGVISGVTGARLTKRGTGLLELTGNNTYNGETAVVEGTLRVNGQNAASRAAVSSGGTLEGTGTMKGIGSVGGRISPGSGGFGTLNASGDVTLNSASRLAVQVVPLTGVASDRLAVAGTVNLGGATLQLQPLFVTSSSPGAVFRILDNDGTDPVTGTFANLPENATLTAQAVGVIGGQAVVQTQFYRISYRGGDGNDVVLTYLNTATMARDLEVTPGVVREGKKVTLTGRLVDPDPRDELTLRVDWGDGSPIETFQPGTHPFRLKHRYGDIPDSQPNGGAYVVKISWFDQEGAGAGRDLPVTIDNVSEKKASVRKKVLG